MLLNHDLSINKHNKSSNEIYSFDSLVDFGDLKISENKLSNKNIDNTIPKIIISNDTPQFMNCGKDIYVIYVDHNDKILLKLLRENKMNIINEKYKIFRINESYLQSFINDVLSTDSKYVYPMVFVNFVKVSLHTNKKISFDDDELLKLRVWSNQLRMAHGFNKYNSFKMGNRTEFHFSEIELYLGYKICCEILYYITYICGIK